MAKISVKFVEVIALIIMCMLVIEGEALTCSDVNTDLFPCLSYITSGGNVPGDCCNGLQTLVNAAKTKADRQTACSCLKSLTANASDEEIQRAASIPNACDINVPFTISRDMDCSKVKNIIGR